MMYVFIFFCLFNAATAEFWLTTTIEDLNFDSKCISFSRCDIPESSFQLSHSIPAISEAKLNNFPVVHLAEKVSFISYWDYGSPENVVTEMSIVKSMGGKPNMLWFCDETSHKILITELIEKKNHYSQYMLKGRCFNATISLQKHLSHACPWCAEATPEAAKYTLTETVTAIWEKITSDNYIMYPVMIAAILAVLLILMLCCTAARAIATFGQTYAIRKHAKSASPDSSTLPIFHTNTTTSPLSSENGSYINSRVYNKRANMMNRMAFGGVDRPYDPVACMAHYAGNTNATMRPILTRDLRMPGTPCSRVSTPSIGSEDFDSA